MRKWSRSIGISGTLIIHLSLLLQFIVIPITKKPPPPPPPGSEQKEISVALLPPIEHSSIVTPPVDSSSELVAQVDPNICKDQGKTYLGVGFRYSPFTNLVTHIPEYYPAYRAGMRIGDMVLDPDTPIVDGYLDIEVVRGYQQMHFRIKAEQICYKARLTNVVS
jgi:hypothetical protein